MWVIFDIVRIVNNVNIFFNLYFSEPALFHDDENLSAEGLMVFNISSVIWLQVDAISFCPSVYRPRPVYTYTYTPSRTSSVSSSSLVRSRAPRSEMAGRARRELHFAADGSIKISRRSVAGFVRSGAVRVSLALSLSFSLRRRRAVSGSIAFHDPRLPGASTESGVRRDGE